MARQVNFDPFGSYLQGMRWGQQDEMGLQQATREARAQDYNFNTLAPLQLQQLQQGIDFDQLANPMRLDAMGDQNLATQLGMAGTFGQETGNMDPRAQLWEGGGFGLASQYPVKQGQDFVNQDNIFRQMPFLIQQEQMDQRGVEQQADAQRTAQYGQDMRVQALLQSGVPPQMIPYMLQVMQQGMQQPQPGYGQGQGMYAPYMGNAAPAQEGGVFDAPPDWQK